MNKRIYYVYVYTDPIKPGDYIYGKYKFEHEPLYVGQGKNKRYMDHIYDRRRDSTYKGKRINKQE